MRRVVDHFKVKLIIRGREFEPPLEMGYHTWEHLTEIAPHTSFDANDLLALIAKVRRQITLGSGCEFTRDAEVVMWKGTAFKLRALQVKDVQRALCQLEVLAEHAGAGRIIVDLVEPPEMPEREAEEQWT